jgi:uncharacterized protein (DUF58 family)
MINNFKNVFVRNRLYYSLVTIVFLFILGYFFGPVYLLAKLSLLVLFGLSIIDILLLFSVKNGISAQRIAPLRMSNGDINEIRIIVSGQYLFNINFNLIDELPHQFQIRDFKVDGTLLPAVEKEINYKLNPLERGEYNFGQIMVFAYSFIGLMSKRYKCGKPATVAVYPSFMQMRKYEFLAVANRMEEAGIKKIRQKGVHSEFDKVREYVQGDDYRTMNWKATARKGNLMVNQYQDEKSKEVYCIIDKSRLMKMPFDGLSLLDYSINSSLTLCNIALLKHDKAGLIAYNTHVDNFIGADSRPGQLQKIMEALYNQQTNFLESNLELLYLTIKKKVHQRSLLILFTNYESLVSIKRNLNQFKELSRNHLLLVIIFKNTEIEKLTKPVSDLPEDIYAQITAEKFIYDKKIIVRELNQQGIHAMLTNPQNLTLNLINKYLEFKSLGML